MVIRQRAIQAEDKQERHEAILDAAERMLARSADRLASMADVADEAGLAKGTVYLYFAGKEELLLAVHERNVDAFFQALSRRLARDTPMQVPDVLAIVHEHIVGRPLFLTLASHCSGLAAQGLSSDAVEAFRQRMDERLARTGAGLERHFRQLAPGGGVALLRSTYALVLGLWIMSGTSACPKGRGAPASFEDELDAALRALWHGAVAGSAR